jgi:hypothetical protein
MSEQHKHKRSGDQLELGIPTPKESDRNHQKGGRSFYFFDFDDNVVNMLTTIVLFHKKSKKELPITTHQMAEFGGQVGESGPYKDYEFNFCDESGSFRHFRDPLPSEQGGIDSPFLVDLKEALKLPEHRWKAPSWNFFSYAVTNQRPLSIITARGHHPNTVKQGINLLCQQMELPHTPNYLAIFPVSHLPTRDLLEDSDYTASTSELKRRAIIRSVQLGVETYGNSPYHRFGMSDDDPQNIELITQAMTELKRGEFSNMSFFVINTHQGDCLKQEILASDIKQHEISAELDDDQPLSLFDN